MFRDCGVPLVRFVDRNKPLDDRDWMDAARRWRALGAPYRAVREMLLDDYGLALDEESLRYLLTGTDWSPRLD